jgi:hypothetical protein
MHAGTVPALVLIVRRRFSAGGHRLDAGVEVGIEEERERGPIPRRRVSHAGRRRGKPPLRHAVRHVADVADERIGQRRRGHPARPGPYFQAAGLILQQDGEPGLDLTWALARSFPALDRAALVGQRDRNDGGISNVTVNYVQKA